MRSWLVSFALFGILLSCNNKAAEATSAEAGQEKAIPKTDTADWIGEYFGTVPSSKDIGLEMKLILNPSNTYSLQITHLRTNPKDNEVKEFTGEIHWDEDSTTIVLKELDSLSNQFKVKPGKVEYLNPDATPNTGTLAEFYTLKKK